MNNNKDLYLFSLNIQIHRILSSLIKQKTNIENFYLPSIGDITSFINSVKTDKPKKIIGLGIYTGKDQDMIRIETLAKNRFRNNLIESKGLNSYLMRPFVLPSFHTKLAQGLGNSYCNLISYLIMQLIELDSLESKYTFLHIPKKLPNLLIISELSQILKEQLIK
jgi:pyrrolidone-carboxylate peptidase